MTDARLDAGDSSELGYTGSDLAKHTNWWGAFVIGLAGTILVTGIAPVMVTTLGAASIPARPRRAAGACPLHRSSFRGPSQCE